MQSGRILFFSAPCGFGKTVVANALLRKWRTLCLRADAPDFSLQALPDEWDILLIDEFQLLQEQETSQILCELIRANPTRRFVFKFLVYSNGTLAVEDSYTGKISRVELQAGGALERFGGEIGELVLSNAAAGSTSTGYNLKLWNGNTNACTIGKITDSTKSKG